MRTRFLPARTAWLLAVAFAIPLLVSAPAFGDQFLCAERDLVLEQLKSRYDEARTAAGIAQDGRLVEVFSSPTGSWTILITFPGGPTCLLAAGEDWHRFKVPTDEPTA